MGKKKNGCTEEGKKEKNKIRKSTKKGKEQET